MNLFTDATPWSVAAIIPVRDAHYAQAFQNRTEINRAELTAAIKGLSWAASLETDTQIPLYVDNASTFCALRSGSGRTLRQHNLRAMFLSMLHSLNGNTYEVQPITGNTNPADKPSRAILETICSTLPKR